EDMDNRTPLQGARVVARAWTDPQYRELLLRDGNAACEAIGIDRGPYKLVVVENTEQVHNVIVCTLCSCYPRWLLGLPPDWYKSRNYRSRVINEPREVLREFGTEIPDDMVVRVHDSTADMRYLVLPRRPAGTEGWSEEKLASLVTRDAMIGVAFATQPRKPQAPENQGISCCHCRASPSCRWSRPSPRLSPPASLPTSAHASSRSSGPAWAISPAATTRPCWASRRTSSGSTAPRKA